MPKQQQKWIQKAVHPGKEGTYTARAKKHGGMTKTIRHDLHSKNATTRHRAQFAANMRAIARKRKH